MTVKTSIKLLAIPAILSVSRLSAARSECSYHEDCAADEYCELEYLPSDCAPDEACSLELHVATVGSCVSLEEVSDECVSDDDCGEYFECAEPSPQSASGCVPLTATCEADSECPRGFECHVPESACSLIDCADGIDCSCELPPGECLPAWIDCEVDDECPSGWGCYEILDLQQIDEGAGEGACEFEEVKQGVFVVDEDCEGPLTNLCVPNEWGTELRGDGADGSVDGGTAEGGPEGDPHEEDSVDQDAAEQGGGCSVAQGTTGTGGWFWMFLMSVPLFLRRRLSA